MGSNGFKVGDKVRLKDQKCYDGVWAGTMEVVYNWLDGDYTLNHPVLGHGVFHWHELEAVPQAPETKMSPGVRRIYKHLKSRGTISPMEALAAHGCMRLAPRIHELRQMGIDIRTDMQRDESGHPYARYSLVA